MFIYRVLPNSTDKFRGVLVGIKSMKNYHKTWGHKPCLVGENRKKRRQDDSAPDEDSGETNARIRSTAVKKKKPSRMQISHA